MIREETDAIFASARKMFLRYAKRQHEPISNVAKRELDTIENNYTFFTRKGSDLEKFRAFPEEIRKGVLVKILAENWDLEE